MNINELRLTQFKVVVTLGDLFHDEHLNYSGMGLQYREESETYIHSAQIDVGLRFPY